MKYWHTLDRTWELHRTVTSLTKLTMSKSPSQNHKNKLLQVKWGRHYDKQVQIIVLALKSESYRCTDVFTYGISLNFTSLVSFSEN